MAINFYLARKHNSPLYPSNPRDEALALQWCFWETDRLDRQLADYQNHTALLRESERSLSIANTAWAEVEPSMNALNGALSKSPWLAGPDFSVADLNVAAALWRGLTMDLNRWPAVRDWLARCWDRPAGKKARTMREG
jgi:glutathione S-transferase